MDNPQVTDCELAWLAGIWDGEGTISVRRTKKIGQISPRVSMVNTNPLILNRVCKILDKLEIRYYMREKGEGGFDGSSKQCWIVSIDTLKHARKIIDALFPFLVGKLAQAELLLKFVNSRIERIAVVRRFSDAPYTKEELSSVDDLYNLNGNQRGTSETIREAIANNG